MQDAAQDDFTGICGNIKRIRQERYMSGYYDEILSEIKEAMAEGRYSDAEYMVRRELGMPYIPAEAEAKLQQLKKDLAYALSENKAPRGEEASEDLLAKLNSDKPHVQLAAADSLADRNLRSCTDAIRAWLGNKPQPEAAALIVEAIAEQEIAEEFTLKRDGLEYTFWGDAVVPVMKSGGFLRTMQLLEERYAKEPSTFQLARMILVHKAYLYLPLSYEEYEAESLAEEVEAEISGLMDASEKKEMN